MNAYKDFNSQSDKVEFIDSSLESSSNNETPQKIMIETEQPETYMNTDLLAFTVHKLAKSMDVSNIDKNAVLYLALATQKRLQEFVSRMVEASRHRVFSQTVDTPPLNSMDQPVYKVVDVQDIRKQLLAIERVEREEERKRRDAIAERERNANISDGGGEGGDGDDDNVGGSTKKKKKKKKDMGPGVTARNMSEDISKKSTNETALMSAGGIRKSWMLTGMNNAPAPNKDISSFPLASSLSTSPASTPLSSSTVAPLTTTSSSPKPLSTISSVNRSIENTTIISSSVKSEHLSIDDMATRGGRGRPRGRKSDGTKRSRNQGSLKRDRSQDLFLPPSMIGKHQNRLGEQPTRKVTVIDAMYVLEWELDSGCESGNRALIKSYNRYLK
ncbi:transcription initiation factor TFIID component TAF4 family-domain-containing protein [Halteromyces radiatus]|uniref:transcription initiation factor TFIID component TAF4 family-domain-containing protein n=1 Tax=Halteromyces radiatus TaxID=101107 RepID=UPI00221F81A2|nr:transcription initiation factor TFIID component TAF4 family-domain-containing protein [Halteromyces radiatus]KAI8096345.1 transcription initiation factor TFIID component TAF4 family-domain-containing protein [Halteromyces radiatus]